MSNNNGKLSGNNEIELLKYDTVFRLYIEENKLYLILYENIMTDKQLLSLYETLEKFYDVCQKKNKRFFFIIDFSLFNGKHPNAYDLLKKCVTFLDKHKEFYKKHKISTICIVDGVVVKLVLNMVLQIYTPVRPFKFYNVDEEVVFDNTL